MTAWNSLYLSSEQPQQIIDIIHDYFDREGYTGYNPFDDLPTRSYPQTLKMFLAPAQAGWSRLLLDDDSDSGIIEELAAQISKVCDCLSVRLEGNIGTIHGFREGHHINLAQWAQAYSDCDITAILNTEVFHLTPLNDGQIGDIPLSALPDDIQQMAQEVNAKEANKLFEKLSNRLLKAIGRNEARNLINEQLNWDSQGGQYIRAVMDCLNIMDNWRHPDFITVRTAYTIHAQSLRGIHETFAGDEDTLKAVPNVLAYTVLYGGKMG